MVELSFQEEKLGSVDETFDPVGARIVERACRSTGTVLAMLTDADLGRPTPCKSWTVSGVINHVLGSVGFFAELAEVGAVAADDDDESDLAAGNFHSIFDQRAARLIAAFDAPGVLEKILKMPIGDLPGSVCIWIASGDVFAHGWDLAKATGQSTNLDPELAELILRQLYAILPDSMRGDEGEAAFGPKVEVAATAPAADRLAGYLGRTP